MDGIPAYQAVPIGTMIWEAYPSAGLSTAAAVNEQGDAVGSAIIEGQYHAFVYTAEHGVEFLSAPPGWPSCPAVDMSDRDLDGLVY